MDVGSGSPPANTRSHLCSVCSRAGARSVRGKRTANPSPKTPLLVDAAEVEVRQIRMLIPQQRPHQALPKPELAHQQAPERCMARFTRTASTAPHEVVWGHTARAGTDTDWPSRWERALTVTRTVSSGHLAAEMRPVGPTGVTCTYPQCAEDAEFLMELTGTDIAGESPQLCCNQHAAQATFGFVHPTSGDGKLPQCQPSMVETCLL